MAQMSKDQDAITEGRILNELRKNAKMSIEMIAKNCGVSKQKVYRIIKHLEETHKIWGYTAIIEDSDQGLQKFILILKRSGQPISRETADTIASNRYEELYANLGISIESSFYVHGEYDWVLIFTAKDLRNAKKFSSLLAEKYPGVIVKMSLMQVLFSNREHYVFNPDPDALQKFL